MQIKMYPVAHMTLQEFAEKHDLVMEINERDPNEYPNLPRYYASFEYCEVKGNGVLISAFGNGETIEDAMEDYTKQISGKILVFFPTGKGRFELQAPILSFAPITNDGV